MNMEIDQLLFIIKKYKDMSGITLYWDVLSQPSRAVQNLLQIGKIPCNYHAVNIFKGETKHKEFLDVYPLGKLPFLKSDQVAIGESGAIMVYLCEKFPQLTEFYGATPEQRAVVNQYISWYQNFFRPAVVGPLQVILRAFFTKKDVSEQKLHESLAAFDATLSKFQQLLTKIGTKFIAGNHVTVPDFLYYHELTNFYYLEGHNISMDKYPQVKRYYDQIGEIAEVKASIEAWKQEAEKANAGLKSIKVVKSTN